MVRVLVIDLRKIFEAKIITSSFCFAGIIRHRIVLLYLLAVLRLLCALQGILTGNKVGLLFHAINWQLTLSIGTNTIMTTPKWQP